MKVIQGLGQTARNRHGLDDLPQYLQRRPLTAAGIELIALSEKKLDPLKQSNPSATRGRFKGAGGSVERTTAGVAGFLYTTWRILHCFNSPSDVCVSQSVRKQKKV